MKQCRCLSLTEKTRRCCRGRCSLTDKEGEILASTRQGVPESYRLSMQPPDRCSKTADSPLATVSSSSHHPWLRTCFRFVSQTHLLIGLEEYGLHDSDNAPRVGASTVSLFSADSFKRTLLPPVTNAARRSTQRRLAQRGSLLFGLSTEELCAIRRAALMAGARLTSVSLSVDSCRLHAS